MSEHVSLRREETIATILLDRPAKLNALTVAMYRRLQALLEECDRDTELRCIVIRGAGGRAFSVGADIGEFEATRSSAEQARAYAATTHPALAAIRGCRHPVVALIDGLCVGGGLGIAVACDLRVCGESSRFGIPIKRLGLVESHEELAPLVAALGASTALELLLTGDLLDARTARRVGLVNRVVPDYRVASEAYGMAARIAEGAPLAARWHKRFVYDLVEGKPLGDADRAEGYRCFDTEDFRIGYQAFLAKTTPRFLGR